MNLKCWWGLVFICLVSSVIYNEFLEIMDVSLFLFVLRYFFIITGFVLRLRCDREINFVGVKFEIDEVLVELDKELVVKIYRNIIVSGYLIYFMYFIMAVFGSNR